MEKKQLDRQKIESVLEQYRDYLSQSGGKYTNQRETIVRVFLQSGSHLNAEELFRLVQKENPRIGLASIYRTLNSLVDANLASEQRFLDNSSVYEFSDKHDHHDHLVCTQCSKIIEFENDQIEYLQEQVAKSFGFHLTGHTLELYGVCKTCRQKQEQ